MSESLKNAVTYNCTETAPCAYSVEFKLAAEFVNKEFNAATKMAQKQAQLPGFRAGKAPASMVKARFKKYILDDVKRSIQGAAFDKLSADTQLDIVSFGQLKDEVEPAENADYSFIIEVETAPDFELPDYKSFKIETEEGDPIDKRVASRVEYMKGLYADFLSIEEPAQKGDMLKVSYESDYVAAEDASASVKRAAKADDAWLWLNEPEQFPGIIAAMEGAKKGDERAVSVSYPADWREAALQGQTVNYKFKVHEAQRKVAIENDEKLAERMGAESVEKMMEQFKADAEREAEFEQKEKGKEKALEMILKETAEFPLPKDVQTSTEQREFSRIAESLVRSEKDVEAFKADSDKHMEEAKKNAVAYLRKFFILRAIAKKESISVSAAEVDAQIKGMSAYMGYKEEDIRKMLDRNGGTAELQADILMSKVLEFVAAAK